MTLTIPPEMVPIVKQALENHAAYLRGYKDETRTAAELLKLADKLKG
jgi:hypothetical protein